MRTPTLSRPFVPMLAVAGALLLAIAPLAIAGKDASSIDGIFISGDDSGFRWVMYDPDEGTVSSNTDGDDWPSIHRSLRNETAKVLWFKLDGRHYLVRDADVVARAEEITEPVRELGRRQGELGARQGALGAEQGKMGAIQGKLAARQARLSARLASLSASATRGDDDDVADLRRERRYLENEIRELGEEQSYYGRQQAPLGAKQGELGRQQGELGRQQAVASKKAGVELRELVERAIRDGKAERIRGTRAA